MSLHPKRKAEKPESGYEPLEEMSGESEPKFEPKSRGKKPRQSKIELEESEIKFQASYNKLMAQLQDINDKIANINSGLTAQKATLDTLVKEEEKETLPEEEKHD